MLLLFVGAALAQDDQKTKPNTGTPVMWEHVNVAEQDLFLGPGGTEKQPDLSNITFLEDKPGGHSTKYEIKDGAGRKWVAKVGDESRSETAAVRLVWALGYKTEINYLIPKMTIPGKGELTNVRLEARGDKIKREGQWQWDKNPFVGTKEFQGLKIMMVLFDNWDMKEANNVILRDGDQLQYVISDLGATFGRSGAVGLPLFWRVGRSRDVPEQYVEADFIKNVKDGKVSFSFKGKNTALLNNITKEDGRWLADLLIQLSDKQISDAFRAANYPDADITLLTQGVKSRIRALDLATQ